MSGSFLDNLDFAKKAMEVQKGVLCSDNFLIHKRPEIAGYFAIEPDTSLQTEYFKNCFHFNTYYGYEAAGIPVGFYANEEGIHINMTGKPGVENETHISWEDARFFVNSYMEDDVYLLPGEKAEQIDTNGMYQQLDLFSLFSEQVGSIAMKEAEDGILPAEKAAPGQPKAAFSQEQVDTILRSGGGRDDSRKRIYAKYQQGKMPEEMAQFLKKEYGTTGKGFEFEGKQVAVWFDGQGMRVGKGTSAMESPALTMDWKEIEVQIRSQVENGSYMGANEAYLVDEVERGRIANFTAYFFYDGMGEMPEEIFEKVGNRSDAHERMVELLSSLCCRRICRRAGCTAWNWTGSPGGLRNSFKCEWILCPVCGSKTRNKIRKDSVLKNYPLYCPKCRQERLIKVDNLKVTVIREPDA